jgi:hypothetical protein
MVEPKDLVLGGEKFKVPQPIENALGPVVDGESSGVNVGVQGSSRLGSGVVGITASENPTILGFDVAGIAGVEGIATKSVSGVSGTSDSGPGVVGKSTAGSGVFGVSRSGIGVHGKGGQFAGKFEGDVTVEGSLSVQGNDLIAVIQDLRERLIALEASGTPGTTREGEPTHVPAMRPSITTVVPEFSDAGVTIFHVTGSGFLHGAVAVWRILNLTTGQPADVYNHNTSSSVVENANLPASPTGNNGNLEDRLSIKCQAGDSLSFRATDGTPDANDFTDLLWSNTFRVSA